MKLDISTLMMIFFLLALSVSIWKIYAFLPNKQLEDDDRTPEAQKELERIMSKVLKQRIDTISNKELYVAIKEDESFDDKRFWRFNQNRLNIMRGNLKKV
ncbi:hypothetical protein JHD46_02555 [Sulfurimonas sp. SAG-AH-194-C20]|nr:hypothetical protein [Sulfurimonas sp. SAG-AH-194-C20]MDF1878517.1 hypothetical protein [Sulfurimonas sp. SAG-AH-194-C20]